MEPTPYIRFDSPHPLFVGGAPPIHVTLDERQMEARIGRETDEDLPGHFLETD